MSLGNNRDYKTNSDRVTRNLRLTSELAEGFEKGGLSRYDALERAGDFVLHPVRHIKPDAVKAIQDGYGERKFVATFRPEFQKAARKAYRAAKVEVING